MIVNMACRRKIKSRTPEQGPALGGETLQGDENGLNIAPRLPEETITHVSRSCKRVFKKTGNPLQRDSGENILLLVTVREKIC